MNDMKIWAVLLLLGVIAAKQIYADDAESETGGASGGNDGGNDGIMSATGDAGTSDDGVDPTETTTDATSDETTEHTEPTSVSKPAVGTAQRSLAPNNKRRFFTNEWRQMYSLAQLKTQAKWRLAKKQPEDGTYQTRIYPLQWWSKSHTPCEEENLASGNQYMNLYFFVNGFNYQRRKYPLTYPVLFEVDKRPVPTQAPTTTPQKKSPTARARGGKRGGKRGGRRGRGKQAKPKKVCPVKYTTYFYLPIPTKKWAPTTQDKSIRSFKMPQTVYYVREYSGNYTTAYCAEQGRQLAMDLLRNNVWTWETNWLCAKYEPPAGETEQKFEVWMKRRLQE